jgi:exonuclease SbcD
VIALPFVNEFYLKEDTFQRLIDAANGMNTADLPIIFSAHTAVRGIDLTVDFTGHENSSEDNIGGISTINIDALGSGYDYLALGHIHKPQFVRTGKHNARYCGTPLDVSFDENYKESHSVTILEIDHHGETLTDKNFRFIPIENIKPLVTLPAKGAVSLEEAEQLLHDYPDDIPAYVRLNVNDIIPDRTKDRLKEQEWLKKKKCILCCVNDMREEQTTGDTDSTGIKVQDFKKLNPIEIAKRYAREQGLEFGEDLQELFNQVMNIVNEEERQQ